MRDPLLEALKERQLRRLPRRTPAYLLSVLLTTIGAAGMVGAAFLPWDQVNGGYDIAVNDNTVIGGYAFLCLLAGSVLLVLSLVSLVRKRSGDPRFLHWAAVFATPVIFGLMVHEHSVVSAKLTLLAEFYASDFTGPTGFMPGFTVEMAAIAVAFVGPWVSLRQLLRARR